VDFEALEQELRDQVDEYRSRHLSVKLSLYAGFFAFEGPALAAAALISSRAALNATGYGHHIDIDVDTFSPASLASAHV